MRRRAINPDIAEHRSRQTTYGDTLAGVDGRTALARRYRDIVQGLLNDLGGPATEAEKLQVRVAATMALNAERLAVALVAGEPIDQEELSRATNGAGRALGALRRTRRRGREGSTTVGLAEYLAAKPK